MTPSSLAAAFLAGLTDKEMAKKFHLSVAGIKSARRRHGLKRQEARGRGPSIPYAKMDKLIRAGKGPVEIGKLLKCSYGTVSNRKKAIGLQKPKAKIEKKQTTGKVLGALGYDYAAELEKDFRSIHRQVAPWMPYDQFREKVNEAARA